MLTRLLSHVLFQAEILSAAKVDLSTPNRRIPVHSPVAQLVEQVAVNHRVGGSSPSRGAFFGRNVHIKPGTGSNQKIG